MNDILTLYDQARRLTDIHATKLDYELDRKAREHGYSDWQTMLKAQPAHLQIALELQKWWLRPVIEEDGDVGGWPVLPAYNPLLPEHLPPEGTARDNYILAIATLLVRISTTRHLIERDKDYACMLGAAFLRWEVADALKENRLPSPVEGGIVLRTLHDRVRAQAAIGQRYDNHFAKVLMQIADERTNVDPAGAALLKEIEQASYGWSMSIVEITRQAFLMFRNPTIAKIVG